MRTTTRREATITQREVERRAWLETLEAEMVEILDAAVQDGQPFALNDQTWPSFNRSSMPLRATV